MVEDIVGGVVRFFGRFIAQLFIEIILELLIKGPGYLIAKIIFKSEPDVDSFVVITFGILFWLLLGVGGYALYVSFGAGGNA